MRAAPHVGKLEQPRVVASASRCLQRENRGIPNDRSKRPSRCGITSERFRLFDENFLYDFWLGNNQDIRQTRPDACDALLVSKTRNCLDVVAQQRSQA